MSGYFTGRLALARRRRRRGRQTRAFTLVELLVTMVVTLILIGALAQAFAIVGESVARGRATIELAGSLRGVANQLQEDLQGLTVAARPWADDQAGQGYLQIVEGPQRIGLPSTDSDPNADGYMDLDPTLTNTTFGDLDDILAFTSRNAKTPFTGQIANAAMIETIQSSLAEIVWWIQYDDQYEDPSDPDTADGQLSEGEGFVIYRRVLLIRPDLNGKAGSGLPRQWTVPDNATGYTQLRTELTEFFSFNDVSVRLQVGTNASGDLVVRATANSLSDLTRRENRFGHWPFLSDRAPSQGVNPQFHRATATSPVSDNAPYDALFVGQAIGYAFDVNRRSITSLYRLARPRMLFPNPPATTAPYPNPCYGQDVALAHALGFDVRVFDPQAQLRTSGSGEAVGPGDPGYFVGFTASAPPPTNGVFPDFIGRGAFVDLGYGIRAGLVVDPANPSANTDFSAYCKEWSDFSDRPRGKSTLPFNPAGAPGYPANKAGIYEYCTWSTHYERGGRAEDGFDSDNANGVDDAGELTTSPPYPVPLRGIQVKIRTWDPDSRQVRQVSVVSNFVPE